jgi:hypothetical protein
VKFTAKILFALGCVCGSGVHAQSFANLNFESANITGFSSGSIPTHNAIPDWNAYISGVAQSTILYDDETLSDPAISLQDTNSIYPQIQGSYAVLLQGQFNPSHNSIYTNSVSIGQSGLIPSTAESLIFLANITVGGPYVDNMQLTFNGQNLSYNPIGSGANYTIYDADISSFAGQTGQLLFTVPYNGGVFLDNIQFSINPVPEPGGRALGVLGGLCLIGCRRQKPFASKS